MILYELNETTLEKHWNEKDLVLAISKYTKYVPFNFIINDKVFLHFNSSCYNGKCTLEINVDRTRIFVDCDSNTCTIKEKKYDLQHSDTCCYLDFDNVRKEIYCELKKHDIKERKEKEKIFTSEMVLSFLKQELELENYVVKYGMLMFKYQELNDFIYICISIKTKPKSLEIENSLYDFECLLKLRNRKRLECKIDDCAVEDLKDYLKLVNNVKSKYI